MCPGVQEREGVASVYCRPRGVGVHIIVRNELGDYIILGGPRGREWDRVVVLGRQERLLSLHPGDCPLHETTQTPGLGSWG